MLTSDPPEHTRLRAAANRFFTPRTMVGLRHRIDAIVDEALVPLQDGEPVELMAEIAYPLTIAVIAELFDVGVDGAEVLREETPALARILDLDPKPEILEDVSTAAINIMLSLVPLVAERRHDPGQDLLSALLADETLSSDEVIMTCLILLAAGHETTATVIGNATAALIEHPEQLHALADHPDRVPAATEELLRYDPPAQVVQRIARHDLRLDNVTFQAGDLAFVVVAAANRDPALHSDPDRLCLDRSPTTHLGFGHGAHYCIGAGLARLELQRLLRKLPRALRDHPRHVEVTRDTSPTFRRIQHLRLLQERRSHPVHPGDRGASSSTLPSPSSLFLSTSSAYLSKR